MPLRVVRHDLKNPLTAKGCAARLARLIASSAISETGCWEWQNSRNALDYGQPIFKVNAGWPIGWYGSFQWELFQKGCLFATDATIHAASISRIYSSQTTPRISAT